MSKFGIPLTYSCVRSAIGTMDRDIQLSESCNHHHHLQQQQQKQQQQQQQRIDEVFRLAVHANIVTPGSLLTDTHVGDPSNVILLPSFATLPLSKAIIRYALRHVHSLHVSGGVLHEEYILVVEEEKTANGSNAVSSSSSSNGDKFDSVKRFLETEIQVVIRSAVDETDNGHGDTKSKKKIYLDKNEMLKCCN